MFYNKFVYWILHPLKLSKQTILISWICFFSFSNIKAQQPNLFPDATWLQDVHWSGTIYAGVPGPIIPSVQAHLNGQEYMFHLKSDVEKARPYIEALHSQGKKYWVNLDGYLLEGNIDSIINDGQGITDPTFGAARSLEGNTFSIGETYVRSINSPAWRNFLISCIKRAIDAGADGSQHDGGGTVGSDSFGDEELIAFEQYINDNSISTSDWNPASINFREYLLGKGKNDNNVLDNDSDPQSLKDLMQHWHDFKAVNSLKSWKMVKDSCYDYAQSKGKEYTIALNAGGALGTHLGHTYFASDYAIGEFFQWGNLFPLTGTLAAKSRAFEAIGKRFICWSSATLEDIPKNPYDPYDPETERESSMQTVATLYASGGLPQLKYPAQETYPAYLLAQANRDILNSVSSAGEIGVVMSHAQTMMETRGFDGLVSLLQDLNRSFKVIWLKSNRLDIPDDLTQDDLSEYKVIFLPEVFYLTDNQRSQLLTFMANGGTVLSVRGNIEYSGEFDENGNTQTNGTWASLADDNQSRIKTHGLGKFVNIAHNILEPSGYPPSLYGLAYIINKASTDPTEANLAISIRDTISYWLDIALPNKDAVSSTMPKSTNVFRYQDTLSHHYVYHFLSDSVVIPSRSAIPVEPFTIELAVEPSSYNKVFNATFYSISNPYGVPIGNSITVNEQTGMAAISIPGFSRWGFVDLVESYDQSKIKVSNLLINNSSKPYRLPSESEIKVTWDVENGSSDKYQIEVWTNINGIGSPVVNQGNPIIPIVQQNDDDKLQKAMKVYSRTFESLSGMHTISAGDLRDSTVYFLRLRGIDQADTSAWAQQYFYRNAKPGAPRLPRLYTSHQNLWYQWSDEINLAPPDTNANLIFSFQKGKDNKGRYGGDYELDTLVHGVVVYTDSLSAKEGNASSNLHVIGTQFRNRLGPFEGGDDIIDTLQFSLDEYENYGIYIQPYSMDAQDTSEAGPLFGFYLDQRNDPPNPFNLISPANNSYTQTQIPFSWESNGDPDPFNKSNSTISSVDIIFDTVATFDSPAYKKYGQNKTGSNFEQDTINLNLPPNFFQVEGFFDYEKIYWKAVMYDYDRDAAEGGGEGSLGQESSDVFVLYIGNTPNKPANPTLKNPINNSIDIPNNTNLSWNAVENVSGYRVQLSTEETFKNIIIDNQIGPNPVKNLSDLESNKTYFWRVKSMNGGVESDWSAIWKFTTILNSPEKAVLVQPFNKAVISSDTVKFTWNNSKSIVNKYWFEYSTDSLFTNSVIDSALTDTSKILFSLGNNNYWWRVKAKNSAGWGAYSSINSFSILVTSLAEEDIIPTHYKLDQNYPNPFNPSTTIKFSIPKASNVDLSIFNLLGEKVLEVLNEYMNVGHHEKNVNLQTLSSGIYVYKLTARDFVQTKKMILLK